MQRDAARSQRDTANRGVIVDGLLDLAGLLSLGAGRGASALSKIAGATADVFASFGRLVTRTTRTEGELTNNVLKLIPGEGLPANRKQLRDFYNAVEGYGFKVVVEEGRIGAAVSPSKKTVYLAPGQQNLSTLADEYSHIFNTANGRGKYLPDDLAKIHRSLGGQGTRGFSPVKNTLFHQLELANLIYSGNVPSFVRAIPKEQTRTFINSIRDVVKLVDK